MIFSEDKFKLMCKHKLAYWNMIEDYKSLLVSMAGSFVGSQEQTFRKACDNAKLSSPIGSDQHSFFNVALEEILIKLESRQAA